MRTNLVVVAKSKEAMTQLISAIEKIAPIVYESEIAPVLSVRGDLNLKERIEKLPGVVLVYPERKGSYYGAED